MAEILKLVLPADTYPNEEVRAKPLEPGDSFMVPHTTTEFKVGENYRGFNNLVIVAVHYRPQKWWQIWKKKELLCYEVRCIGR